VSHYVQSDIELWKQCNQCQPGGIYRSSGESHLGRDHILQTLFINEFPLHQQYYWTFMVVTAFSGTSLAQLGIAYLAGKNEENNTFASILVGIAQTLPSQVSANWLNWIILRTFIILPLQYMLQVNTFIFQWLGWKCCRR